MATEFEAALIGAYLIPHFGDQFQPLDTTPEEPLIVGVLDVVRQGFGRSKYPLGLAFDFAVLAQRLSRVDADARPPRLTLTPPELFARYPRVVEKAGRVQNTLTVQHSGVEYGIRKTEEEFVDLLLRLQRPGYPSAYVYNTGQWLKYQDTLLLPAFRLSESGRHVLIRRLLDFALAALSVGSPLGRNTARVRLFDEIIAGYPRAAAGERSGTTFQAVACGYVTADRGHLSLVVDKVRSGSARQARIGDIDGYYGMDLEVSVEVKDEEISGSRVETELGEFLRRVQANHVMGLAFVRGADAEAVALLAEAGVACLTEPDLRRAVATWDWAKQDVAVNAMLHYLAHVEQNPDAAQRLLVFIAARDPKHESLAFLDPAAGQPNRPG